MIVLKKLVRMLGSYKKYAEFGYRFECPRCTTNSGKMHMYANIQLMVFHCFKCKYGGSLGNLVGNKLPNNTKIMNKREVINNHNTKSGIGYIRITPNDDFVLAKLSVKYLEKRGISPKRAYQMKVGYAIDGKFSGRLIIPIFEDGEMVYFVARSIDKQEPKELSPQDGLGYSPRKSVLYGLDELRKNPEVIIVEGIFDCERLKSYGYDSVSTIGSNFTNEHLGKIMSKKPKSMCVMYDGDEAGRIAAKKAMSLIRSRYRGNSYCVDIVGDPDEMTCQDVKECLATYAP